MGCSNLIKLKCIENMELGKLKLILTPVIVSFNQKNALKNWGLMVGISDKQEHVNLPNKINFETPTLIIIIIGIYIAPFPFIKCSKALHIGIVLVIVHNASMGEPEKVCFETLLEGLTRCRILQVLW